MCLKQKRRLKIVTTVLERGASILIDQDHDLLLNDDGNSIHDRTVFNDEEVDSDEVQNLFDEAVRDRAMQKSQGVGGEVRSFSGDRQQNSVPSDK